MTLDVSVLNLSVGRFTRLPVSRLLIGEVEDLIPSYGVTNTIVTESS